MRIADYSRFNAYTKSMGGMKSMLDHLQQQISSGKKILSASDDPIGAATVTSIELGTKINEQYRSISEKLKINAEFYNTSISSINELLTRAKEIAISQASSNTNSDTRAAAAEEVMGIIESLSALGNTKVGDVYIFGGKKSNIPPYTLEDDYSVTFNGTADVPSVLIDKGIKMDVGISGEFVFNNDSKNVFEALVKFKVGLETNKTEDIKQAITDIDNCLNGTTTALTKAGVFMNRVDAVITNIDERNTSLSLVESEIADVDIVSAITDYNNLITSYQAFSYTIAKIQNLSIMNYL